MNDTWGEGWVFHGAPFPSRGLPARGRGSEQGQAPTSESPEIRKARNWENSSTESGANLVTLQKFLRRGGNTKKDAFAIVGFSGEDAGHTPVTSGVLCFGYS